MRWISDDGIRFRIRGDFDPFSQDWAPAAARFGAFARAAGALTPALPCSKVACAPSTDWPAQRASSTGPCSWPVPGSGP